jgi:hypothetical protein
MFINIVGSTSEWPGVSKGVKDGRRNGCKAFFGVTRPQGVEGTGMADLGETFKGVCGYPMPYRPGGQAPIAWGLGGSLTSQFQIGILRPLHSMPRGWLLGH